MTTICDGSGGLARFFFDPCPVCETHGRKPDCPCCKGSGQVLTPIKYQLQIRRDLHDDPKDDVWSNVTEKQAREAMPPHWDPDDCISFLYSDPRETADYGLMSLRVKPADNRPEPIKQEPIEQEPAKPAFVCKGLDDWSRGLYMSKKTGRVYVDVDGTLHTMTDWGEPNSPLCSLDAIEIVKE